jgi:hypothetical protein
VPSRVIASPRGASARRHRATSGLTLAALVIVVTLGAGGCRREKAAVGSYDGPYADHVNSVLPKIERGVGLAYKEQPVIEVQSRDQVRAFLEQQYEEPRVVRDLTGQEIAYKRLGAIPDTLKLKPFLISLLSEQIVGFYDPKTRKLYVVEGMPEDLVQLTVTHELVHALQGQYLPLDSLTRILGDEDRALGAQSLTEGQAMLEQLAIMSPGADLSAIWDRARAAIRQERESMPLMAAAPVFIQELLVFPYLSGAEFVHRYKRRYPGRVPFDSLPASTEQIMHESAYFGATRDAPTRVRLPARIGTATIYENGLGEFETRLWLYTMLRDQNAAVRGAMGWDGDRYAVFDTPSGEGIAWVSVWDTPLDAAEFHDLARQAAAKRYGGRVATDASVTAGGRTISVTATEIAGRPAVVWLDVPQGASASVDPRQVTLDAP